MDIPNDILYAMQDDAFQEILKSDEVLNALEDEKNNKQMQYFQLVSIIFKRFKVAGLSCIPITPAIWSFLYCMGNKIVLGGKVGKDDIDQMIYLLHFGMQKIDENFLYQAHGYCDANQIDYQYALSELLTMIELTFRPLQMFPQTGINGQDVRFNVDWLTKIVGMACRICNKTSAQVMFNLSLCQALYYVVQFCRGNDPENNIKRRNSDQINEAIFLRTMELGKQYYDNNYKGK